jgi:hypothetical protein
VSGSAGAQHVIIHTLPVIADPHVQFILSVGDFNLHEFGLGVLKGVGQRLASDSQDLFAHDRMQLASRTLDTRAKLTEMGLRELFAHSGERKRQLSFAARRTG